MKPVLRTIQYYAMDIFTTNGTIILKRAIYECINIST